MRPIKTPRFILPTLLRFAAIGLLIMGGMWYALWQGRDLIVGPGLAISDEPSAVENSRLVWVSGVAENATALYLNGRPIMTDQNGAFTEGVILENGYSVVSIDARDRYGRSVHWEKPVVFVEEKPMAGRTKSEAKSGL